MDRRILDAVAAGLAGSLDASAFAVLGRTERALAALSAYQPRRHGPRPGRSEAVETRVTAAAQRAGEYLAAAYFILANVPQRLRDSPREEMDDLGRMKDKDGETAQTIKVAVLREAAAADDATLLDDEGTG